MQPAAVSDQQLFLRDPSNAGYLQGLTARPSLPAQRRQLWTVLASFGALCVLIAAVAGYQAFESWSFRQQLAEDGVKGEGVVRALRQESGEDGPSYYARYDFIVPTAQGLQTFSNERQVNGKTYTALRVGGPVQVLYAASNPQLSKVNHQLPPEPWTETNAAWICLLLAGGLCVWSCHSRARLQQLSEEGRVLSALITEAQGVADSEDDYVVKIGYRFQTPAGAAQEGKYEEVRNELRDAPLPEAGCAARVFYRDERNFELL